MAKKKKKRIRWVRLLLICALCIGAVGFGTFKTIELIQAYQYEKEQMVRREYIAQVNEDHKAFVKRVMAKTRPEELEQELYDEIVANAIDPEVTNLLDQYNYEASDVSDEYYEEVLAIDTNFDNDYSRLLEQINVIPVEYIESLMEDWDRFDFTIAYPDHVNYEVAAPTIGVTDFSKVPLLIQWDLDWGYVPYGDLNIAIAGCAPTCISMVYSYLLKDPGITPAAVAGLAEDLGQYVYGAGSAHSIFAATAAAYGISCYELGVDQQAIEAALRAGQPVILNMVPGDFTKVGHFIVLTGIKDGKYVINDPNSKQRSSKLWDKQTVLSQTANAWSFSL